MSGSSVQLSWFYSKQPPLRKRFKLASLFSSCWSWSVECISRGGGRVWEIRLSQVFYYRPILYRNITDPRYPSLRRGEEKLRKCQNQWIIFILDENGCVWRMDGPERVRERWIRLVVYSSATRVETARKQRRVEWTRRCKEKQNRKKSVEGWRVRGALLAEVPQWEGKTEN